MSALKVGELYVEISANASSAEDSINSLSEKLNKLVSAFAVGKVVEQIGEIGKAAIEAATEYESAFAGVRKTVDATESEFKKMSDGIRQMAKEMPLAATEIAGVAEAAGQLGIETPNILEFSKVMSDLGVATNMSAGEAATALARLYNITHEQTDMTQEEFDKLGSSIVGLGNNFATTESEIVEMSLRLAGAASQAGFMETDIMGLSAALSSVGVNAQAGGGAMSRVINQISNEVATGGDNLAGFAEVAGMSASEFQVAWGENAPQAFVAFIEGLKRLQDEGVSTSSVLQDLNIKETTATTAVTNLAGAGDLLARALAESNTAWDENIALTNEANQRYDTLESKIQILKNNITDVGITVGSSFIEPLKTGLDSAILSFQTLGNVMRGSDMQSALDTIAGALSDVIAAAARLAETVVPMIVSGIAGLISAFDTLIPVIAGVAAGFIALQVIDTINKLIITTSAVMQAYAAGAQIATVAQAGFGTSATVIGTILAILSGQLSIATVAQTAFNAAIGFITGPIGLAVAAIAVLVAAIVGIVKHINRVSDETQELLDSNKEVISSVEAFHDELDASSKSFEENTKSIETNVRVSQSLADRLYELEKETNKSIVQKQQMIELTNMLNESLPGLGLSYDAEADALNKTTEATTAYIQAKENELKLDAYRERSNELTYELILAEEELAEVVREQEKNYNQLQTAENLSWGERQKLKQSSEELAQEEAGLIEKHGQLEEQLSSTLETTAEYEAKLEETAAAETAAAESVSGVASAYQDFAQAMNEASESTGAVVDGFGDMEDAYNNFADMLGEKGFEEWTKTQTKVLEDWTSAATDMFNKLNLETEISLEEMVENLEHNIKATQEWSGNLDKLAKAGLSEGLLKHLEEAGPESAGLVALLVEELEKGNGDIDGLLKKLDELFNLGLEEAAKTAKAGADTVVESQVDALEDGRSDVEAAAKSTGEAIPEGLQAGIEEGQQGVTDSVDGLSQEAINAMNAKLEVHSPSAVFREIGLYVDQGLENGINEGKSSVINSIASLAKSIISKAKDILGIASPSKELESVGLFLDQGWELGITKNAHLVTDAVRDVSEDSIEEAQNGITKYNDLVEQWMNDIGTLTERGLDENFLSYLQELGPDSATEIHALTTMSDAELAKYVALFKEKYELARKASEIEMQGLRENTNAQIKELTSSTEKTLQQFSDITPDLGYDAIAGWAEGMKRGEGVLHAAVEEIVNEMVAKAKTAAEIHSPSRVFAREVGEPISLGIASGVTKGSYEAIKAVEDLNNRLLAEAGTDNQIDFKNIFQANSLKQLDENYNLITQSVQNTQSALNDLASTLSSFDLVSPLSAEQLYAANAGLYALQDKEQQFRQMQGVAQVERSTTASSNEQPNIINNYFNFQLDHAMFTDETMVDQLAERVSEKVNTTSQRQTRLRTS